MRKMKTLFEEKERVWFWVTDEWKKDFYNELVEFGAMFNNGNPITLDSLGDIIGVWRDGKVGLVSYFVWDMSFGVTTLDVPRVDYGKYRRGMEDYMILTSNVRLVIPE